FCNGLTIDPNAFFCSSIPGMDIRNGKKFMDYIKDELQRPQLVIFVVSTNFLASNFCHAESGAAWVTSAEHVILLVPRVTVADLTGILVGRQAGSINDAAALNGVANVIATITNAQRNPDHWERVRNGFLKKIRPLLPIPRLTVLQRRWFVAGAVLLL